MAGLNLGRKICVYGPSGSGKTTVGREIARRLGLPFVELDAIYHARPNWDDLSREEFREAASAALSAHEDGWVVDGNYSAVQDLILPLADSVVWLRLPWRVVYPRLVWRTVSRVFTGEKLWGTNRDSPRGAVLSRESMLLWGIQHWRPGLAATADALEAIQHGAHVYVIRHPGQLHRFWSLLSEAGH